MALQKAGGTNIDNTVTPADESALIDHLETHLVGAGWTIISGGGTDAIKFESAATPESMKVRIVTSSQAGVEMGLELRNSSESASGATAQVRCDVDGVSTWRLMANKFAFVLFEDTAAVVFGASGAKKWCIAGTLHLESFLTPTITEIGFLFGDHKATGDDIHQHSFRIVAELRGNPGAHSLLYNAGIRNVENQSANKERGTPGFVLSYWPSGETAYQGNPTKLAQWASAEHFMCDPLLGWGEPSRTTSFKQLRGQLFDCIIAMDNNLSRNDIITIGADTFRVVTDTGAGSTTLPYNLLWLQP